MSRPDLVQDAHVVLQLTRPYARPISACARGSAPELPERRSSMLAVVRAVNLE